MNIYQFVSGVAAMGAWVCGTFFLRFWRRTSDRLFLIFGVAFWILAIERIGLAFRDPEAENSAVIYLMRMAAFSTILYGIWDKNRPRIR